MRWQTDCGTWSFHSAEHCQHGGCRWGSRLIYNETGQHFDASHWTVADWQEFCDDNAEIDRYACAEHMTEVPR